MKVFMLIHIPLLLCISLSQDKDPDSRKEKAFVAYFNDSIPIEVDLIYNDKEMPVGYYSHVRTPVCEEGLCYLMVIDLYWDLLGNFQKYVEVLNHPLTKFDHVVFTKEDHEKMYRILSDKTSLLRNYAVKDLIDGSVTKESEVVVDGVSGATYKSLSGAVVRGAVYSSHTLWHIVNGEVAERIVRHTESILSDPLLVQMLQSDNYHLQYYALNKVKAENKYLPHIIQLISEGKSFVPYFAIDKLPKSVWTSPKYQEKLVSLIEEVGFKVQNGLLNKLEGIQLSKGSLEALIRSMEKLRESQKVNALEILKNNKAIIPYQSLQHLSALLDSKSEGVAMMTFQILQSRADEFKEIKMKLKNYNK